MRSALRLLVRKAGAVSAPALVAWSR